MALKRVVHGFTPLVGTVLESQTHPKALLAQLNAEQITYHNGPVIRNVETTPVFLGSQWQGSTLNPITSQLEAFFESFVSSVSLTALVEYSAGGWTIGKGSSNPMVLLPDAAIGNEIDDSQIQAILTKAIGDGRLPQINPNSLYVMFLPDGTTVTAPGVGASCVGNCGYHFNVNGVPYAVLPYPSCSGCLPQGLNTFAALTSTTSHEICEAITNPLGTGWYRDSDQSEIGDLCAWKTKIMNGYVVQEIWSNSAGGCS